MSSFLLKSILASTFLIFLPMVFSSCIQAPEPSKNEIIKTEYPKLAEEITERDFEGLWQFVDHENQHIRKLAWKAIAKSETDDLQNFIDYAIQEDDSLAWYALSLHPLTIKQVDSLGQNFADGVIQSESVCEIFFRKGTINSLNMLLEKPELLSGSAICSQAVGGIMTRIQADDFTKRTVLDLAFNSGDEIIWRNLLYGFYRAPLNRPSAGSVLMDNLETLLEVRGDLFTIKMDQYITRITGKVGFTDVMERRSVRELNQAVQLSNELARNIILFESEELNHPTIKRLLQHNIDNVVIQTLQSLHEFETVPNELLEMIEFEITTVTRDPEVFVAALTLLAQNGVVIDEYRERLEFMDAQNEYLKHLTLPLFSEMESDEEYLQRIRKEIGEGGIGGLRATQALMNYYSENFQENPEVVDTIKPIIRIAIEEGDRSVVSVLNTFLGSSRIYSEEDYEWMYEYYSNFVETSQWDKARVFDEVLRNRFPDRFESLKIPGIPFFTPNWNRLYEMGTEPFWVLKTEKGMIEIQLDPLAAPFTVSSIDSLARAGAYNDVPFHRVVRNFVIQGGDIDRKDGFGGPDYKLPTEPSFKSFERGVLGIASSGQDTEGSQYFMMLGWAPHLDGNYTIFGKVTKGMDVADRIQVGDKVLEARIYSR